MSEDAKGNGRDRLERSPCIYRHQGPCSTMSVMDGVCMSAAKYSAPSTQLIARPRLHGLTQGTLSLYGQSSKARSIRSIRMPH